MPAGRSRSPILAALLITLIPTTIAALLSAIGIAGMDRLVRFNVLAKSGRAVEAAGDVDVLLLDKTGTITIGDRQASEFKPLAGVEVGELADAALLASLADETPEGRSIVVLAKEGTASRPSCRRGPRSIPFTAQTRISGVKVGDTICPEGRGRFDPQGRSRPARPARRPSSPHHRRDRARRHDAARRVARRPPARRGRAQGHRQGRRPRPLRRTAPDGHPHGHDHRRQSR